MYNYKIPCKYCKHKSGVHFAGKCLGKNCDCPGFQADNLAYLEQKYEESVWIKPSNVDF